MIVCLLDHVAQTGWARCDKFVVLEVGDCSCEVNVGFEVGDIWSFNILLKVVMLDRAESKIQMDTFLTWQHCACFTNSTLKFLICESGLC